MTPKTPRLLFLACGGTIGMRRDADGMLAPALSAEELLSLAPSLRGHFVLDLQTLFSIDSSNMRPTHWVQIAERILEAYDRYDGFVVAHGTDTMAYTASALSLALSDLGKPVVLTGALVPAGTLGSDAETNLAAACTVAAMDCAEVLIVFGSHILRGNRATKVSGSDRNAFLSPVFPSVGHVRFGPELVLAERLRRHPRPPSLQAKFHGNVPIIRCAPGLTAATLGSLMASDVDGVVLEAYAGGNLPDGEDALLAFLRNAKKRQIPVIIASQCLYDVSQMHRYAVAQAAVDEGAIPALDMTVESAYVKLLWCLGQREGLAAVRAQFGRSLAGEVTPVV